MSDKLIHRLEVMRVFDERYQSPEPEIRALAIMVAYELAKSAAARQILEILIDLKRPVSVYTFLQVEENGYRFVTTISEI